MICKFLSRVQLDGWGGVCSSVFPSRVSLSLSISLSLYLSISNACLAPPIFFMRLLRRLNCTVSFALFISDYENNGRIRLINTMRAPDHEGTITLIISNLGHISCKRLQYQVPSGKSIPGMGVRNEG